MRGAWSERCSGDVWERSGRYALRCMDVSEMCRRCVGDTDQIPETYWHDKGDVSEKKIGYQRRTGEITDMGDIGEIRGRYRED
eukprot:873812-Rhodomonas_salina.1